MLEGALSRQFYVMDGISLIGTQGKRPAKKTTRQDSLFTSKHVEFGMKHFLVFTSHVFAPDCWQCNCVVSIKLFYYFSTPVPSDERSVLTQGRRSLHLRPSATPPVMEQRRDTDIRRGKVLSVVCCSKTRQLKCHQRDMEFSDFLIWEKKSCCWGF